MVILKVPFSNHQSENRIVRFPYLSEFISRCLIWCRLALYMRYFCKAVKTHNCNRIVIMILLNELQI